MRVKSTLTAPLLCLIVSALLIGSRYIDISQIDRGDNIYLSLVVIQLVIFILPTIFYVRLKGRKFTSHLNLKFFGPRKFVFILFSFLALVLGGCIIKLILFACGYSSESYSLYQNYIASGGDFLQTVYKVVAIAVLPAICEEFLFRSAILTDYMSAGCGIASSIFLSSLLFSMLHFNFAQFPVYLFSGIVLAAVTMITQSVFAAMLVHMLNNISSLFFESFLVKLMKVTDSMLLFVFVLVVLFLISLFVIFSESERILYFYGSINQTSSYDFEPFVPEHSKKRLLADALISPTFLLCVFAFVAFSIIK